MFSWPLEGDLINCNNIPEVFIIILKIQNNLSPCDVQSLMSVSISLWRLIPHVSFITSIPFIDIF